MGNLVALGASGEGGAVQALGESAQLAEAGGVEKVLVGFVALRTGGEGGAVQALCQGAELAEVAGVEKVLVGFVALVAY